MKLKKLCIKEELRDISTELFEDLFVFETIIKSTMEKILLETITAEEKQLWRMNGKWLM